MSRPRSYYDRMVDVWQAVVDDPSTYPAERRRAKAEVEEWQRLAKEERQQMTRLRGGQPFRAAE